MSRGAHRRITDCLLQHGARRVVALDVGHNQIDWRLRTDPRVEVREGVNARHLTGEEFAERFDLAVMDVSFISAAKVLPAVVPLLREGGRVVVLIKPQFEVGKGEVGKGGIVRDPAQHTRVVEEQRLRPPLGLRSRASRPPSPARTATGSSRPHYLPGGHGPPNRSRLSAARARMQTRRWREQDEVHLGGEYSMRRRANARRSSGKRGK